MLVVFTWCVNVIGGVEEGGKREIAAVARLLKSTLKSISTLYFTTAEAHGRFFFCEDVDLENTCANNCHMSRTYSCSTRMLCPLVPFECLGHPPWLGIVDTCEYLR